MKIAVLSGKGGTGKTFVSVNLAKTIKDCIYLDCDVEEPNGKVFFKIRDKKEKDVSVKIPAFDENLCTGCRQCVNFCKYGALFFLKTKPKLISDMCHSCGGCSLVCKNGAVMEIPRVIGKCEYGKEDNILFADGTLNLGETSANPVITAVKNIYEDSDKTTVIDCPPGSSCQVMEALSGCDFALIVAEPTSFGFHNFKMVYNLTRVMGIPSSAVLNKYESEYSPFNDYCDKHSIKILEIIPFEKELAKQVSYGEIAIEKNEKIRNIFTSLYNKIKEEMTK